MSLNKLWRALLFPHVTVMILLLPLSTALLVWSMVFVGTESIVAIVSYVLAAYTLTVWCVKIPYLIKFFKAFKNQNKYALRWQKDARLRVTVSLYGSLIWNAGYALFQLWLGVYHHTFWFYSLAVYYVSLAVMRFFLVRYAQANRPGEQMRRELVRYRACGWVFLITNLALTIMIFFMVYWNRTFLHHEIITIAMAAYTFTSFTVAIVNVVKYRKYNSPVYSAAKAISFASACVSMLTLASTMMTTFGDGSMTLGMRRVFLGALGVAVSATVVAMALYMIANSSKKLKSLEQKEQTNG